MTQPAKSGLSRTTFLMTAGNFFADISTEMLTPVPPVFLTQALGANGSIVGLVDGIAQAIRRARSSMALPLPGRDSSDKPLAPAKLWETVVPTHVSGARP